MQQQILVTFKCPNPDGCMLKHTVAAEELPFHCLNCAHEDLDTTAKFV